MEYKFYSINKQESLKISNEFNIKRDIYCDKVKAFYKKHGLHITNFRNTLISDIKLSDYRKRGLRGESVTSERTYLR